MNDIAINIEELNTYLAGLSEQFTAKADFYHDIEFENTAADYRNMLEAIERLKSILQDLDSTTNAQCPENILMEANNLP